MTYYERAYWLADINLRCDDYAVETSRMLKKQADEIERLTKELDKSNSRLWHQRELERK